MDDLSELEMIAINFFSINSSSSTTDVSVLTADIMLCACILSDMKWWAS